MRYSRGKNTGSLSLTSVSVIFTADAALSPPVERQKQILVDQEVGKKNSVTIKIKKIQN